MAWTPCLVRLRGGLCRDRDLREGNDRVPKVPFNRPWKKQTATASRHTAATATLADVERAAVDFRVSARELRVLADTMDEAAQAMEVKDLPRAEQALHRVDSALDRSMSVMEPLSGSESGPGRLETLQAIVPPFPHNPVAHTTIRDP